MSEQPKAMQLAGEPFWTDDDCASAAAELRRLHALCEESRTVVRDLLNALPSATTHPAIIAARTLAAKLEIEQ